MPPPPHLPVQASHWVKDFYYGVSLHHHGQTAPSQSNSRDAMMMLLYDNKLLIDRLPLTVPEKNAVRQYEPSANLLRTLGRITNATPLTPTQVQKNFTAERAVINNNAAIVSFGERIALHAAKQIAGRPEFSTAFYDLYAHDWLLDPRFRGQVIADGQPDVDLPIPSTTQTARQLAQQRNHQDIVQCPRMVNGVPVPYTAAPPPADPPRRWRFRDFRM